MHNPTPVNGYIFSKVITVIFNTVIIKESLY